MIYVLHGFSGKSEMLGELREFAYEDQELTIKGITLQDARNILGVLASGQAGAPLTYGGVMQEIVNTGAPGLVTPSPFPKDAQPRVQLQEPAVEVPAPTPKAVAPVATAPVEEAKEKPAARRLREVKEPAKSEQTKAIEAQVKAVTAEVVGTPATPQPKEVPQEPVVETQEPGKDPTTVFDVNNLPKWLTTASSMRVLVTGFDTAFGMRDFESIFAACNAVKAKVPFFDKPAFKDRLANAIELVYTE